MRTVYRRCLDGLIILWGIIACLLLSGGHDLLAAPGDCNTDCREAKTFGKFDGSTATCIQFQGPNCLYCSVNGCNSNNTKLNGTCQEDTLAKVQVDLTVTPCNIYCNTITKNLYYEATTTKTDFKYTKLDSNVYRCKP